MLSVGRVIYVLDWTRAVPAFCAALLCVCCGSVGAAEHERDVVSWRPPSTSSPPSYGGRAAELFDDEIEPIAVGAGVADPVGRKSKALVRERTQTGDAVVRARVVTVTSGPEGGDAGWQLGFHTLEKLAGKTAASDFSFVVGSKDPAAGVVRMLDTRLVGATLVVFVRQFGPEAGRAGPSIHFHCAKDDADEIGAVREAGLLGEVR